MKLIDKDALLLVDLCARLPYDTIVNVDNGKYREDMKLRPYHLAILNIWDIKPYLRPMSSMTKEECIELGELPATIENVGETLPNVPYYIEVVRPEQIDLLNSHYFDYRGLIKKGLALEAPKDMYNAKTEQS